MARDAHTHLQNHFISTRFVLVEPSHPGNVGAAARALKTMGFARLLLVRPRLPHIQYLPDAQALASGAGDVLANACVVDSLDDALAGAGWSAALSARQREYGPPALTPRLLGPHTRALGAAQEIAIVFGNERTGLSNAEVQRCRAIVQIPADPAYCSLNLAQAIQLVAYELRLAYLAEAAAPAAINRPAVAPTPLASHNEIEQMLIHLEKALIALDFLDPAQPKKLLPRLRRLFARAGLEPDEVRILRGIARQILNQAGATANPFRGKNRP